DAVTARGRATTVSNGARKIILFIQPPVGCRTDKHRTGEERRIHAEDRNVRRTIATLFGIAAAVCAMPAQAEVTVMAVRLGATDVVALAKFYEAAFGLKEIDRVGNPATEIIMRYGATVADAKRSEERR